MGREKGEGNKQEEKMALRCYSCGVKIPRLREIQPENLTVAGEREEKKKEGEGVERDSDVILDTYIPIVVAELVLPLADYEVSVVH